MGVKLCLLAIVPGAAFAGATAPPASPPDVAVYERVLQEHVTGNGRVRYGALRARIEPLSRFAGQMEAVSPHSHPRLFPSRESKLAYWINAYNALVLWAFAREYPEKRERLGGLIGRGLFFYKKTFTVGGRKLTLAAIENDIIREEFNEPRIHFALVCASVGCPWLAREAYTAENLERLLEAETRRFLGQVRNVRIDRAARVVHLSKLFDWYGADFGAAKEDRLEFVARYRADGDQLLSGEWKIRYFSYDWSPNDAPVK